MTSSRTATTDPTRPITRPDWLDEKSWPFAIHTHHMDAGRIAFTDEGNGPTLLLVHSGTWGFVWRDLIERLRDRFRVIAFDPPAMGLSDTGAGAGIRQTSDALDSLVRALDLNDFVLLAHDLGGPAALEAAGAWPQRVRGFVAVNCFGWRPSTPAFRAMLRLMGSTLIRESDAWTGWLPRATATGLGVGRHFSPKDRRTFRRGMDHRGRRSFHRNMRSALHHDYAVIDRARTTIGAGPVLTVFGQHNDPLRFQPRWKALGDHVEQVVVPHGNHFPMCDDPDLVATALVDWYRRTVGG